MTTSEKLVDIVVQQLSETPPGSDSPYPTLAGARVYAPRDWPTFDGIYPALFISVPREEKEGLGSSGAPEFEVTATIRIAGRGSADAVTEDGGAGPLYAKLLRLKQQCERALINNPALMVEIEQISRVSSQIGLKASGEKHLAEMQIEMTLNFYQGPEDFYRITGAPLTAVSLTTPFPSPDGEPNAGFLVDLPQ